MLRPRTVYIEDLVIDPEVQPRVSLSESKIQEYQDGFESGVELGCIEVHYVSRQPYLCDGFHRVAAAKRAGLKTLLALVEAESTRAKLLTRAVAANALHGQALTAQERRNSVIRLVEAMNAMGEPWTQEQIGKAAGFHQSQVSRILASHFKKHVPEEVQAETAGYDVLREREADRAAGKPKRQAPVLRSQRALDLDIEVKRARDHTDWMVKTIKQLRHRLSVVANMRCGSEIRQSLEQLNLSLDELWAIDKLRPMSVCEQCQGGGCEACKHKGWLARKDSR
ncbi:MAG: hypothetical protein ACX94C_11620 [Phycisphaerales bacterium]